MTMKYYLLLIFVFGFSVGQIFLKLAVDNTTIKFNSFEIFRLFLNKYFIISILLYFLSALLWAYLLSQHPISSIYPFVSLAFVIVPILAFLFLGEKMELNIIAGSIIIFFGLVVLRYEF